MQYLHAAHDYKAHGGDSRYWLEVKVPDNEAGQDGKGEVGDDTKRAVHVAERHDDVHGETTAVIAPVPIEGHGVALQQRDKEECSPSQNRAQCGRVYNPPMDPGCDDAQQEPGK